jgi:hypothetical protein
MTDPQEDALYNALQQADANGDSKAAANFAARIKALRTAKGSGGQDSLSGDPNDIGHEIYAGLHGFEDAATFGLGDRAAAFVAHTLNPSMSVDQAYQNIQQTADNSAQASPIVSGASQVAGMVAGGGGIAKAGKVIPALGRVLEGSANAGRFARVARTAAVGAGFGAADAVGHGEDSSNVLLSAGEGAIAGPVLATVGTAVARRAVSISTKAMMLLAEKIKEPPEVLQRYFDQVVQETGRPPPLASIVDAKARGELRQLAASNTTVGGAVSAAADESAAQMPTLLGNKIKPLSPGGEPETIADLITQRKDNMTAAMSQLNDKPVTINGRDADLLNNPYVRGAFSTSSPLRAKLAKAAVSASGGFADNSLTVEDIDQIRQGLRKAQANMLNPTNPHRTANSVTAKEIGEVADQISGLASRQYKGYATALQNFAADSDYIHGFKHGNAGNSLGDAENPEVINALGRPAGQKGFTSGRAAKLFSEATDSDTGAVGVARDLTQQGTIRQNTEAFGGHTAADLAATGDTLTRTNNAINEVAPRTLTPEDKSLDVSHLAHGAAALTYHNPTAIGYHISRVFGGKLRMSNAVATKVAQYLADPKMSQKGINLLKKAGASNADLLKLATSISASTGIAAGRSNASPQ